MLFQNGAKICFSNVIFKCVIKEIADSIFASLQTLMPVDDPLGQSSTEEAGI
jgi:hypothetical protein